MIEVKPPHEVAFAQDQCRIFLAGSIEQGKATEWQKKITDALKHHSDNVVIFNPRRDNWDSTWKQDKDNPQFAQQVEWELDHLEKCHIAAFYFQPGTYSPISMLELGLVAHDSFVMKKKVVVFCPEGFWRKGNIDIVSEFYDMHIIDDTPHSMDNFIEKIKELVEDEIKHPESKREEDWKKITRMIEEMEIPTLQQCKLDIAKKHGYSSIEELKTNGKIEEMHKILDEAAELYKDRTAKEITRKLSNPTK